MIIRDEFLTKKEPVNWNNVMKLGFDIKNSWTSQKTVLDQYSGLNSEMENLSNELFSNLRGNSFYLCNSVFFFLRLKVLIFYLIFV